MAPDDFSKLIANLTPEDRARLLAALSTGDVPTGVAATGQRSTAGGDHAIVIGGSVFLSSSDPAAIEPKVLLSRYLERLIGLVRDLKLDVIDRSSANERSQLQLAAVFTELSVSRIYVQPSLFSDEVSDELGIVKNEQSKGFSSAVGEVMRHHRLAILGSAGSGKSSFVDMLVLCLAGSILGRDDVHTGLLGDDWLLETPWLPVRVVLRNFAAEASQLDDYSIWNHIERTLGDGLPGFGPLLKKHLIETGGLLLLDGLDEVPEADRCRERVKTAVGSFADDFGGVRILLTSRTYAWRNQDWRLPGFEEAELAPFTQPQWETFIDRWYGHLAVIRENVTRGLAEAGSQDLKSAIESSSHLQELASSPLLLTLMASLHALRGGTLPRKREKLYERSVELLLDVWQKPKAVHDSATGQVILQTESAAEFLKADPIRFQEALEKIAFEAHRRQHGNRGTVDIPESDLIAGLSSLSHSTQPCDPKRLAEFLRDRAGILVHEGSGEKGIYRFPHRTFQEYLAARYLTRVGFPDLLCELVHHEPEKWREVFLLAGAKAAAGAEYIGWVLAARVLHVVAPEDRKHLDKKMPNYPLAARMAAVFAGQFLVESDLGEKNPEHELTGSEPATREQVINSLISLVESGELDQRERCAGAAALGRLGDPRPGVGLQPDGLPWIEWCEIEAGEFLFGDEKQAFLIDQRYSISKYPVTVVQYQAFIDAGGYAEAQWWQAGRLGQFDSPTSYSEIYETPNHPRVGVSWYEAMAFGEWLTAQLYPDGKDRITLPTEQQWERAARHTDGRIFPWGDEWDGLVQRCNSAEYPVGHTSAVGAFPQGMAECGAHDFSGNVFEWCENVSSTKVSARVLRGGAFWDPSGLVRCAGRVGNRHHFRLIDVGFRVCSSPILG